MAIYLIYYNVFSYGDIIVKNLRIKVNKEWILKGIDEGKYGNYMKI